MLGGERSWSMSFSYTFVCLFCIGYFSFFLCGLDAAIDLWHSLDVSLTFLCVQKDPGMSEKQNFWTNHELSKFQRIQQSKWQEMKRQRT